MKVARVAVLLAVVASIGGCAGARNPSSDRGRASACRGGTDGGGCTDGEISYINKNDGCRASCVAKCAGAADGCGGTCPTNNCKGCCDGITCRTGIQTTSCGVNGGGCVDCTTKKDPCQNGSCVSGLCVKNAKADGTACTGGKCWKGACCTGCWNGSECRGGVSADFCGSMGGTCGKCTTASTCKTASCAGGKCAVTNKPFGFGCPGGRCLLGNCCTGCISQSACYAGTHSNNCGSGGGNCTVCLGSQQCINGLCW